jgi:hypothetical protein
MCCANQLHALVDRLFIELLAPALRDLNHDLLDGLLIELLTHVPRDRLHDLVYDLLVELLPEVELLQGRLVGEVLHEELHAAADAQHSRGASTSRGRAPSRSSCR